MMIDRLGEKTILVTLMRDDMRRYELDFDAAATESTRRGLTRLMYRVGEECGLDHRDKSYLIEALPGRESCLLIISVRVTKSRRRYRIKRESLCECCRFLSADDMLDWMARADSARLGYRLYRLGQEYFLLPEYPLSEQECCILNEYGSVTRESPVAVARIRENAELIGDHTRRRRHSRYISNAAM